MFLIAKYNTQTVFTFPMIKRGLVDLAASADWTPATGDTKISKDGGNVANTTNNPSAVGGTGSVIWTLTLTATELSAAVIDVQIVDSATKAVEDQFLKIYTYGNASAKVQPDFSDVVRLGLTALPNAAAEAAGGLYTRGTGAGQVNQPANGMIDSNVVRNAGTAITAASGIQEVKVASIAANAIADAAVATDMDSYAAKVWVTKQGTTQDEYSVTFYKNGTPIESGITSPLIDYVKKLTDGSILVNDATLTEQSNGDYYYVETTNKLVAGKAYMSRVTATIDGATRVMKQNVSRDST